MFTDANHCLSTEQIASSLAELMGAQLSVEQTNALRCICDRLPGAATLAEFVNSIESNAVLLKEREHAVQFLAPILACAKKRNP